MAATIVTKPKISIAPELLKQLKTQTEEQGQVILHFLFRTPISPMLGVQLIRIWPTTYLYDYDSDHKSELVHAENITYYPEWYPCLMGTETFFTLIFSGLPKSCTMFEFKELCDNQAGAFHVKNIKRNKTDVYYLKL